MSAPTFTQGKRNRLEIPRAEVAIAPPGHKPSKPETSPLSFALPAAFTVIGLVVMVILSTQGSGSGLMISMAFSLPMMLGSYIVSFLNFRNGKRKYERELKERETRYTAELGRIDQQLTALRSETQRAMIHSAPLPDECQVIVEKRDPSRMWARQSFDDDFLDARLGVGDKRSQIVVTPPSHSTATDIDSLIDAAQALAQAHQLLKGVPIVLPLARAMVTGLCGDRAAVLNTVRTLLVQVATHHSPEDVRIVVLFPEHEAPQWTWTRWLPHVWSEDRDRRYLACTKSQAHDLIAYLGQRLEARRASADPAMAGLLLDRPRPAYLFVLADPALLQDEPIAATLLKPAASQCIYSVFVVDRSGHLPPQCKAWAEVKSDGLQGTVTDQSDPAGARPLAYEPDAVTLEMADRFARTLAPVRIRAGRGGSVLPDVVTIYEILGIHEPAELGILQRWETHDPSLSMAVPVGRRAGGDLQYWDLQEARGGEPSLDRWQGPNALVAGTVGSGKSELLRSLLLSLASHMHPHRVCFVLLDFKTPGLVDDVVCRLPHTLNAITDLQIALVPRALESLRNELRRRESLFEEASRLSGQPVKGLQAYQELHEAGVIGVPLPYLILVVDEFARLRQDLPDALDHFVAIAIAGRAFGFRMVLATQKPSGIVTGQIDANTQYRACLRVAKVEDSREVVGDDEAAYFTRAGRVHWRVGQMSAQTYQSAYPGAAIPTAILSEPALVERIERIDFDGRRATLSSDEAKAESAKPPSQYETLVTYIENTAAAAGLQRLAPVWLEPLPAVLPQALLPVDSAWNGYEWRRHDRWLSPVIGLRDNPATQTQPPLTVDLARFGHLFLCAGAAASARMALRVLIERLVGDHSPDDVHLYLLDLGSSGLQVFTDLPHTGAVIRAAETRRLRRLFRWLSEEAARRRERLDTCGKATLAQYRASGLQPTLPAIVVVVDNPGALKDPTGEMMEIVTTLTAPGQNVGIHVIISGDTNVQSSGDLWKALNNVQSLRLALQLDGPLQYRDIVGQYPDTVVLSRDTVGRGLTKSDGVLECQVAEPSDEADLIQTGQAMVRAARAVGCCVPQQIRDLPDEVRLGDLLPGTTLDRWRGQDGTMPLRIPVGLDDASLEVSYLGIEEEGPHYLITGPLGGGKTTALRAWSLALAETYPKSVIRFALMDTMSASLAALKDLPHTLYYGTTLAEHQGVLQDLKQTLETRTKAAQQHPRPLILVVADDYQYLKLESEAVMTALKDLALRGVLWGIRVALAAESGAFSNWDDLPKQVLASGSGLFVGSTDIAKDGDVFGLSMTGPDSRQKLIPGRGYLIRRRTPRLVQIATPGDEVSVRDRVRTIAEADGAYEDVP